MYEKQTKQGYKIVATVPDYDREHVVAKRENEWIPDDYIVCLGYDKEDGTWAQGMYGFKTVSDALEALIDEKYSYKKNSLIKHLLEYVDTNTDSSEELYQILVGQIQMTESEIDNWGYGYCIPE